MIDYLMKDGKLDADAVAQAVLVDQAAIVLAKKTAEDGSEVPLYGERARQASARIVLEWCKAKPTATTNVNVNTPDQFLMDVAQQARTLQHAEATKVIAASETVAGDIL